MATALNSVLRSYQSGRLLKINYGLPGNAKRRRFSPAFACLKYVRLAIGRAPVSANALAGARPIGRGRMRTAAKDEVEEVAAAAVAVAAISTGCHAHRLGRRVGRPLDGDVGDLAFAALENLDHLGVATIDILAELEFAVLVEEGGLIGQVHPEILREVDVYFVGADHFLQPSRRIMLVGQHQRQQLLAVNEGILHPHATMAVSALILGEQIFIRRVVLIDQELVGEVESLSLIHISE